MVVLDESLAIDTDISAATGRAQAAPTRTNRYAMAAMLFAIYVVVSLFTDPNGYLSTDVGGKTASLEAMVVRGDWDPDIGYWFEDADPDGEFYPFSHTTFTPNEQWVNTTSLTMIYPMRPLWAVGGARLALLIPILGAVATAMAAGALERRLNPNSTGTWSFWIVGLATPTFVYALDLWEHTLGLAGMAIGVVAVHDIINNRNPTRAAAIAGAGYGFAATMRQEALVYGLIAGLLVTVMAVRRHSMRAALTRGMVMAVSTVAMLAAHTIVEYVSLGGPLRLQRSATTVASATGTVDRIRAIAATLFFPFNGDHPLSYGMGIALLVGIFWLTVDVLDDRDRFLPRLIVISSVVFCALFYLVFGPRFVPGLVPTTPLAVVGVAAAWRLRSWFVLIVAVLPLPILFAVQFPAGAIPQWGGRYLLLTGLVLTVAAIALLREHHRSLLMGFAACGLAVTLFGVTWTEIRKDQVTDDWDTIEAVTETDEVVVWRNFVDAREAGSVLIGERWLSAWDEETQENLAVVLRQENVDQFVWIDELDEEPVTFAGYEATDDLGTLGFFTFRLTRYSTGPGD